MHRLLNISVYRNLLCVSKKWNQNPPEKLVCDTHGVDSSLFRFSRFTSIVFNTIIFTFPKHFP